MVDLMNATLREEMRRNPDIVVFGEDVADCSREENLSEVKGKGGVFKVTAGLQIEFGAQRCFNTPLAEASIVGRAIGMATRGLKPVAEIQFFDYIWPAMMQIRDELATMRWRSNGGFSCPVVLRVPIGGYLERRRDLSQPVRRGRVHPHPRPARGDAFECARTPAACCAPRSAPTTRCCFWSTNALSRAVQSLAASRAGFHDSVRQRQSREDRAEPDHHYLRRAGAEVAAGGHAGGTQGQSDVSIEVIDLRTLAPYDWDAIRASVEKTNRVIVAHEDCISWGYGAEIAARIADELFDRLDAPVRRVGALDTWVGYHPQLENAILPQVDDLAREAERLLAY